MKLDYSGQNLIILNFNLFVSHYENLIIDDLIKYGLVESPLTNKDVKKLFYHHLIKIIVDEFIFSNKSVNRLVMVFNTETAIKGRLREYYGDRELINFLYRFINKLENMSKKHMRLQMR